MFLNGANKADLFGEFEPGSDEKRQIFTALWDNYHSQNAEKVFLWVARFVDFQEPLSSDGIIPTGSFWVKSKFSKYQLLCRLELCLATNLPSHPTSSFLRQSRGEDKALLGCAEGSRFKLVRPSSLFRRLPSKAPLLPQGSH